MLQILQTHSPHQLLHDHIAAEISKLEKIGIHNAEDILLANKTVITRNNISIVAYQWLLEKSAAIYAHNLEPITWKPLSTCISRFDALMGGLSPGQLVEFAGPISSGKSQFCHLIAKNIANSLPDTVLYVSTGGSFSAKRLASFEPTGIPSNISILECFDIDDLACAIDNADFSNVSVLIIDSVASLLSPLLGKGQSQGYIQMFETIGKITGLMRAHSFCTIVTNYAVKSSDVSAQLKPALGEYWSVLPTQRLFFDRMDNGKISVSNSQKRIFYRILPNDIILDV